MKTILALAAIFVFQTAHSEETFDVGSAKADAWIYQQTHDVWALPAEIQLMFHVCLKNHDSGAPLNRFKFVVFNADTIERATNEVYESNGSGCFRWYEKFPLAAFPESISPVKVRRTIRPVDTFKGFSTVAEFIVIPDSQHPSVTSPGSSPDLAGTISEAEFRSSLNLLSPAKVLAKNVSLRLLSMNWKAYQAEIAVDIEPFVKMTDWKRNPIYHFPTTGAFTILPVLILSNDGSPDALKPVAEGSSSISYIDRGHLFSTITVRFSSDGFPNLAHFYLGLRLTPANYEGKQPVRESDLICEMGSGLAALGMGSHPRDCKVFACLDDDTECSIEKYLPNN